MSAKTEGRRKRRSRRRSSEDRDDPREARERRAERREEPRLLRSPSVRDARPEDVPVAGIILGPGKVARAVVMTARAVAKARKVVRKEKGSMTLPAGQGTVAEPLRAHGGRAADGSPGIQIGITLMTGKIQDSSQLGDPDMKVIPWWGILRNLGKGLVVANESLSRGHPQHGDQVSRSPSRRESSSQEGDTRQGREGANTTEGRTFQKVGAPQW